MRKGLYFLMGLPNKCNRQATESSYRVNMQVHGSELFIDASYSSPEQLELQALPENVNKGATINATAPTNIRKLGRDVVELGRDLIPVGEQCIIGLLDPYGHGRFLGKCRIFSFCGIIKETPNSDSHLE